MKITYAITVCNESRDLFSLISFLIKVKDPEDNINVLIDTAHVTTQVRDVLKYFESVIIQNEREFDGKFSTHRNYHASKCDGDYIFIIDPDEMPHEFMIKNLKNIIKEKDPDIIWVPRINICPGFTQEWLVKRKFNVNEFGWINWPDYISRVYKNNSKIYYSSELHEKLVGGDNNIGLPSEPRFATWHIKSVDKQENRWNEDGTFRCPEDDNNLYDSLM